MRTFRVVASALLVTLAACGGGQPPASGGATPGDPDASEPLPRPQPGTTSVTGMPDPGMGGSARIEMRPSIDPDPSMGNGPAAPDALSPAMGTDAPLMLEDNPESGLLRSGSAGMATPAVGGTGSGVADAVRRVSRYYAAIDRGDLMSAYALWGDGGAASGQTPEQFANGFSDIVAITVTPGDATLAGTGDRVDVPVTVTSTRRDGGTQTSVGLYVLRATADGREWRIVDARLRPLQP